MTNKKQNTINKFDNNVEPIVKSFDTEDQGNTASASDERRKSSKDSALFNSYFTLDRHVLSDLLSTKLHSDDFIATRTSYITIRLWFMCMFFALSVPIFSGFDFVFFPNAEALELLVARIVLSLLLFSLAYLLKIRAQVTTVRFVMPLAFLAPMIFYVASMMIVSDLPKDEIPSIFAMLPYFILAMLGLFPLTISGGVIVIVGILVPFISYEVFFIQQSIWLLVNSVWLFLLFAGISLWLQVGQLSMLMKLYRESTVDPLTKLINRRVLLRLAQRSNEGQQVYSLIMFDLDRFKRINDNYGHAVGDKVLVNVAKIIQEELRTTDIVARFGGEEFVAVLPNIELSDAKNIANRVALSISRQPVILANNTELKITSSVGVTQRKPGEILDETLKRADDLLYFAKNNGRDQVICDDDFNQAIQA
ncbi:GGDEF domain-containing protein [Colwellia psychrerythraea]|uniref:diguanylate cyclase n=1 Tax=Colwellia psychrerythraea TaxID=28229 RepID=A0A099KS68_COLPS|nr:GGDEF domain-containing protein [Colwellia psychrerythraea]KGJ92702.1 diguanylate cyclase [Colwellia psychrerythraea]